MGALEAFERAQALVLFAETLPLIDFKSSQFSSVCVFYRQIHTRPVCFSALDLQHVKVSSGISLSVAAVLFSASHLPTDRSALGGTRNPLSLW